MPSQLFVGKEFSTRGIVRLLGRVVNMPGEPVDGKGPVKSDVAYPVEKIAPGIIRRRPVSQPVQTGIMPIDVMIPIGRGRRRRLPQPASGKKSLPKKSLPSMPLWPGRWRSCTSSVAVTGDPSGGLASP